MGALGYAIKLWMVNEKKEAVFGDGLAELIEEIDKYHSILKAAETFGNVLSVCIAQDYFGRGTAWAIAGYTSSWRSKGRRLFRSY